MTPTTTTKPSGKTTFGISDFRLIEVRKHYGPQLQFTFTWLLETKDGKQFAQSTPGFRYVKRTGGKYQIIPPSQKKTTYATYYSSVFSTDLLDLIEEELVRGGWKDKVGSNNDHRELVGLGEVLAEELRTSQE